MSILIKGLEMPKEGEWISVNISHDGKCFIQSWCGKDFNFAAKLTAVPVPPHGRLIDADALYEYCALDHNYEVVATTTRINEYMQLKIDDAPTVIEAEEGE